ncbi:MAG: hypothetical protein ACE5Q6_20900 [Dehalococcoidia bacterium]
MFFTLASFLGAWFATMAAVWFLFEKTESTIAERAKTVISRYLQNLDQVSWSATFTSVFDSIFPKPHFSRQCFVRSSIASLCAVGVLTSVFYAIQPDTVHRYFSSTGSVILIVLGVLGVPTANLIPDFISLGETRYILKRMGGNSSRKKILSLLVVDFAITLAIAVALVSVGFILVVILDRLFEYECLGLESETGFCGSLLHLYGGYLIAAIRLDVPQGFNGASLGIFFYSTFVTSVWLWLYALSTFVVKLGWLKSILDIKDKPLRSLGIVSMGFVTVGFIVFAVAWIMKGIVP